MLLAEFNLIEHLNDHPWPGCTSNLPWLGDFTWMSSAIASMIIVALLLIAVVLPLARKRAKVPSGGRNVLEVVVIFVRDMIAKPALHQHAYKFLPFLLTLFVYFLGLNLIGLIPLVSLSSSYSINGHVYPIGYTATSILTVTGAHAALVLLMILYFAMKSQAIKYSEHTGRPLALGVVLSPALFIKSLVPKVPGVAGVLLWPMLVVLEISSVFSKCVALMIRLFANMLAGHSLLAVFMMFIVIALQENIRSLTYVGPLSILGSVFVDLLEVLVASLQAYIFTFLTAIFIGLYMEPSH